MRATRPKRLFRSRPAPTPRAARNPDHIAESLHRTRGKPCIFCGAPASIGGVWCPPPACNAKLGAAPGKSRVVVYALCAAHAHQAGFPAIEAKILADVKRAMDSPACN